MIRIIMFAVVSLMVIPRVQRLSLFFYFYIVVKFIYCVCIFVWICLSYFCALSHLFIIIVLAIAILECYAQRFSVGFCVGLRVRAPWCFCLHKTISNQILVTENIWLKMIYYALFNKWKKILFIRSFFCWSKTFCIKTFGRSVLEKRDEYNRSMNISIERPKENIDLLWKSLNTQHIFNKVIEIIETFQIRSGFTYNLTHIHQKDRKKSRGTSFNGYNRLLSLICVSFHSH